MSTFLLIALLHQNPYLPEGIAQVRQLDERAALSTLDKAKAWKANTPKELAEVYLWSGLAHAGLADGESAVEAFRAALLLDPALQLPPGNSPLVKSWWARAGGRPTLAPTEPPPTAPSAWTATRVGGLVVLGSGVAAAAVGLGLGFVSRQSRALVDAQRRLSLEGGVSTLTFAEASQHASLAQATAWAANVLFVAAGALGLTGTLMMVLGGVTVQASPSGVTVAGLLP